MISLRCIMRSFFSWFSISSFLCFPSFSSVLNPQPIVTPSVADGRCVYGGCLSKGWRFGESVCGRLLFSAAVRGVETANDVVCEQCPCQRKSEHGLESSFVAGSIELEQAERHSRPQSQVRRGGGDGAGGGDEAPKPPWAVGKGRSRVQGARQGETMTVENSPLQWLGTLVIEQAKSVEVARESRGKRLAICRSAIRAPKAQGSQANFRARPQGQSAFQRR